MGQIARETDGPPVRDALRRRGILQKARKNAQFMAVLTPLACAA